MTCVLTYGCSFRYYIQMGISDRLKLIRKKVRYKQKELSDILGVTNGYICDLERGIKFPSKLLIKAYCSILNVNEEWLLTGQGKMFDSDKKAGVDIVGRIESLYALKNNGAITEEEFNLLKNKLLSPLKGKGTDA